LFVETYSEACKINIKPNAGTISHSLEILKRKTIHGMNTVEVLGCVYRVLPRLSHLTSEDLHMHI